MNDFVQKLLAPVSEAQPCGPDYSYDPKFDELEAILKGKPEVEIGSVQKPAEPPEWGQLKGKSAEFLTECKHLRVAVIYTCSLLQTEGVTGFRDGLELIKAWLEQYWSGLYPLLDPDDNNDPTQRLNILGSLTAPRGSASGWLKFVDYLYTAEVCRPKGLPPLAFGQLLAAKANSDPNEISRLGTAIRGADVQVLLRRQQALQESFDTIQAIDGVLTNTLGAGGTISFEAIEKVLREMLAAMKSVMPEAAAEGAPASDASESSPASGEGAATSSIPSVAISINGSVRSRDDVVRVIDSLCDYYAQVEPSSPVPYVLRRAQKMVKMDFIQTMHELNLATVETLRPSMGSAVDSATPPAA